MSAARPPRGSLRRGLALAGQVLVVLSGAAAFAVAVGCFFVPNRLLSGGVSGSALLVNTLFGAPVGLLVALFNLPIFVLGVHVVGRRFAALSALAVVAFWIMVDGLPLQPLTTDPMLAGIFGGLLSGVGSALSLRAGGSLGGFDILGVVLNRRYGVGIGEAQLVLNGILITAEGFVGSPELAMFTLVGIFVAARTVDAAQAARPRKAFMIVTRRADAIRARVLVEMHRGLTVFGAEGGFSREATEVLLCVVRRQELRELQEIVREEDPAAFVVVLEASEVMGYFRDPGALASRSFRARKARTEERAAGS